MEWRSLLGHGGFGDIAPFAVDDILAVGGEIERYDGNVWRLETPASTQSLRSVWAVSRNLIFAVGRYGAILRYENGKWHRDEPWPEDGMKGLNSVWACDRDCVFASGDAGRVVQYDGSTWSETVVGSDESDVLWTIWGTSPTSVYVTSRRGLLRFDGTEWELVAGLDRRPVAVWGLSDDALFVAATAGSAQNIFFWNGYDWSAVAGFPPVGGIRFIAGTSVTNLFVSTGNEVFHYDGYDWTQTAPPGEWFGSIRATPDGTVFGGGRSLLRWSGTAWDMVSAGSELRVTSISASRDNDLYIGAETGLYRHNGAALVAVDTPREIVTDVEAFSDGTLFVISDSRWIHHNDRGDWSSLELGSPVRGLWGASPSDVYVIGYSAMWHYDGTTWEKTTVPEGWWDVHGSGDQVIMVGGSDTAGTARHFDGMEWTEYADVAASPLKGVWMAGPGLAYAVAEDRTVHVFESGQWRKVAEFPGVSSTNGLVAVWGTSDDDVWASGASGLVVHYDGASWKRVAFPSGDDITSITGRDDCLFLGSRSSILELTR